MNRVFIVNSAAIATDVRKKSNRKCHSWLHDGTDVWTEIKINMWENLQEEKETKNTLNAWKYHESRILSNLT